MINITLAEYMTLACRYGNFAVINDDRRITIEQEPTLASLGHLEPVLDTHGHHSGLWRLWPMATWRSEECQANRKTVLRVEMNLAQADQSIINERLTIVRNKLKQKGWNDKQIQDTIDQAMDGSFPELTKKIFGPIKEQLKTIKLKGLN